MPPKPAPRTNSATSAPIVNNNAYLDNSNNLMRSGDQNNSNNTSRVVITTPQTPTSPGQMPMPSSASSSVIAEPVYELEKKGHTSVIRVSYPAPEPTVTFPPSDPSSPTKEMPTPPILPPTAPIPPARRSSSQAPPPPPTTQMGAASAYYNQHGPPLPLIARTGGANISLDNFKFSTVLGRGHFGKVRTNINSSLNCDLNLTQLIFRSFWPDI